MFGVFCLLPELVVGIQLGRSHGIKRSRRDDEPVDEDDELEDDDDEDELFSCSAGQMCILSYKPRYQLFIKEFSLFMPSQCLVRCAVLVYTL